MYRLKSEMVDRINFDEFQRNACYEAITSFEPRELANAKNLDGIIAAFWEDAREEIESQVDDIEEAYGCFMTVWKQEFGLASEAAYEPDEA
jgi:hypothetical protein